MKNVKLYIAIILSIFVVNSCDKPSPVEITSDLGEVEQIEILTFDYEDEYYSSGADSTGVTNELMNYENIIVLTGAQITSKNGSFYTALGKTIFFDKSQPVKNRNNNIIGFKSIENGQVFFDENRAWPVDLRIRYREQGILKDTLLGKQYVLYNERHTMGTGWYRYNNSLSYKWIGQGQGMPVEFNIPTPAVINAEVTVEGKKNNKSLNASLNWQAANTQEFEIIFGAAVAGSETVFPLYKLKTKDDGYVKIPKRFLNAVPFNKFDRFVITLVRKYTAEHTRNNKKLNVLSQSIHRIFIDIP